MIDDLRKQVADLDVQVADIVEKLAELKYRLSVIELDNKGSVDRDAIRLGINKGSNIQEEVTVLERLLYGMKFKRDNLLKRIGEIEQAELVKYYNDLRIREYGLVVAYNAMADEAVGMLTEIMKLHVTIPDDVRDKVIKSVIGSVWNIPKFDLGSLKIRQNYTDEEYLALIASRNEGISNEERV